MERKAMPTKEMGRSAPARSEHPSPISEREIEAAYAARRIIKSAKYAGRSLSAQEHDALSVARAYLALCCDPGRAALAGRLKMRLDRAVERDGSEEAAVKGPGVVMGYLLALDIYRALLSQRGRDEAIRAEVLKEAAKICDQYEYALTAATHIRSLLSADREKGSPSEDAGPV